jgi:serine/threonine protein kinase
MTSNPATDAPLELVEGDRVGPYRIVRHVAAGSMGTVYQATDALGVMVALKVLSGYDDELLKRFEREGRMLQRVLHPNVVRALGQGVDSERGVAYLACEYVPGRDLQALLARVRAGRLSVGEALFVLERCARGLAALHREGLIHRDIKLSNVLVTQRGEVKLIDFGVALATDTSKRLTQHGVVMGTPSYLAPEVWREEAWTPAADLYALGCVTFRLLTGQAVFPRKTIREVLQAHCASPPPRVRDLASDVPEALSQLIDRLLSKSPTARPTALELIENLQAAGLVESTERVASQWGQGQVGYDSRWERPASQSGSSHGNVVTDSVRESLGGFRIGPYQVKRRLGKGSMGDVFLAKHTELNKNFAVKVLSDSLVSDGTALARFQREMASLIELNEHPGVVSVHHAGRLPSGRPFYAMDYVGGTSLAQAFARGLEREAGLDLIDQLADALGFAHARGLVHRDVKPQNVIVTPDRVAKLLDFGLVKAIHGEGERLTHTGEILGTPSYMAPEQVDHAKGVVGPWTDVFGLGALLYELLAGKGLRHGKSSLQVYTALLKEEPTLPVSKAADDVPVALAEVCERAIAPRPEDRYPNAREFLQALRRARVGEPVPFSSGSRTLVILAAGSALLLATLLAVVLWGRTRGAWAEDLAQVERWVSAGQFERALVLGEGLAEGGDVPADGEARLASLLGRSRLALLEERLRAGDAAGARPLLDRLAAAVPERGWVLASCGEFAAALAAWPAGESLHRARVAAWAGNREACLRELATLREGSPARAAALQAELSPYLPRENPPGPIPPPGTGWAGVARGEAALSRGAPGLAALAFSESWRSAGSSPTCAWRPSWARCASALPAASWTKPSTIGSTPGPAPRPTPSIAAESWRWPPTFRRWAPRSPGWRRPWVEVCEPPWSGGRLAFPWRLERFARATAQLAEARGCVDPMVDGLVQLAAGKADAQRAQLGRQAQVGLEPALRQEAPSLWLARARAHLVLGDGVAALRAGEQALTLAPGDPWILLHVARAGVILAGADRLPVDLVRLEGGPRPRRDRDTSHLDVWEEIAETCREGLEPEPRRSRVQDALRLILGRALLVQVRDLAGTRRKPVASMAELKRLFAVLHPLLAGVDLERIPQARRRLGEALLHGVEVDRAWSELASLFPGGRPDVLAEALWLLASSGHPTSPTYADAYLALLGDLPARGRLASRGSTESGQQFALPVDAQGLEQVVLESRAVGGVVSLRRRGQALSRLGEPRLGCCDRRVESEVSHALRCVEVGAPGIASTLTRLHHDPRAPVEDLVDSLLAWGLLDSLVIAAAPWGEASPRRRKQILELLLPLEPFLAQLGGQAEGLSWPVPPERFPRLELAMERWYRGGRTLALLEAPWAEDWREVAKAEHHYSLQGQGAASRSKHTLLCAQAALPILQHWTDLGVASRQDAALEEAPWAGLVQRDLYGQAARVRDPGWLSYLMGRCWETLSRADEVAGARFSPEALFEPWSMAQAFLRGAQTERSLEEAVERSVEGGDLAEARLALERAAVFSRGASAAETFTAIVTEEFVDTAWELQGEARRARWELVLALADQAMGWAEAPAGRGAAHGIAVDACFSLAGLANGEARTLLLTRGRAELERAEAGQGRAVSLPILWRRARAEGARGDDQALTATLQQLVQLLRGQAASRQLDFARAVRGDPLLPLLRERPAYAQLLQLLSALR